MQFFGYVVLTVVLAQGFALQCYSCKNCTTVPDGSLKACPGDPDPTTTQSPTTLTTATATASITTPSTITTPSIKPTIGTTIPTPDNATVSPSTKPTASTDANQTSWTTISTPTTLGVDGPNAAQLVYRHLRFIRSLGREAKSSCFTHKYTDTNGHEIVDRGCTSEEESCKEESGCSLCSKDRCNSAGTIYISFVVVISAICLTFVVDR